MDVLSVVEDVLAVGNPETVMSKPHATFAT